MVCCKFVVLGAWKRRYAASGMPQKEHPSYPPEFGSRLLQALCCRDSDKKFENVTDSADVTNWHPELYTAPHHEASNGTRIWLISVTVSELQHLNRNYQNF